MHLEVLMKKTRKIILSISIAAIIITMLSVVVYRGFSGRAALASVEDNYVMGQEYDGISNANTSETGDDKGLKDEFPDINGQVVDYDSIPGLTSCKPFDKKLVESHSLNILIIGEDKEAGLFDTIGIMSIDQKNRKFKIIMIPRDTYIEYNEKVIHYLDLAGKLNEPGFFKINNAHHIGPMMKYQGRFDPYTSINFLTDVIKEKFGIEVRDYIKINTESFVEIVDLFGGVDIYVPYEMNYDDPTQDLSIHLEKGMQHLDGKKAEGFVRYRKGYKSDGTFFEVGDPGRKKNQINFIKAFIQQHGTIGKINKIPSLLKILGRNIQHSIGLGDLLINYMGIAKDIVTDKYEIESENLDGELKWINSSQYVIIGE
jgi:LCP family protein required for cell wall assembly